MASGGLSHFVIDEDLDQKVLTAMTRATKTRWEDPGECLQSGHRGNQELVPVIAAVMPRGASTIRSITFLLPLRSWDRQRHGVRLLGLTFMDEFVSRLGRLDSCAVSDALDKLGLKGSVTGLHRYSHRKAHRRPSAHREAGSRRRPDEHAPSLHRRD